MNKILLFVLIAFMSFCIGCMKKESNAVVSSLPYEIIDGKTISKWYAENGELAKSYNQLVEKVQKEKLRGVQTFNYKGKTYILISSGEKSNGGFQIVLKECIDSGNLITIGAEEIKPKSGQAVLSVISYPSLLMSIKQTSKQIHLTWS